MQVKKVAVLIDEEKETLVSAGKIVGTLKQNFEDSLIDDLSTETGMLFEALYTVIQEVNNLRNRGN